MLLQTKEIVGKQREKLGRQVREIFRQEMFTDQFKKEIDSFLAQLAANSNDEAESRSIQAYYQITHDLERIARGSYANVNHAVNQSSN